MDRACPRLPNRRKLNGADLVRPTSPDIAVWNSIAVHAGPPASVDSAVKLAVRSPVSVASVAVQTSGAAIRRAYSFRSPRLHGWLPQLASFPSEIATGATWLPSGHIV